MASQDLSWWREISILFAAAARSEVSPDYALRTLQDGLSLDAALVCVSDTAACANYTPVVVSGYAPHVVDYMVSEYVRSCPGYEFAVQANTATRIRDTPFDFRETRTFAEVLGPAGFREGVTVPFFSPWAGQRGFLAASSATEMPCSDETRLGLTMLSEAIAGIASPVLPLADILQADDMACEIDQHGRLRWIRSTLSNAPASEQMLAAFAQHLRIARLNRGGFRVREKTGVWWHIKGYARTTPNSDIKVLVVMTESTPQRSVTERELDILALICGGMTNSQIASELFISLSTVKSHIEALLHKLDQNNRSSLVAVAVSDDLWSARHFV